MTPVLVSVDKAGDLKLGKRKCRLHKKEDVVKVAKNYGVPNTGKKTVKQLCGSIKAKAKARQPRGRRATHSAIGCGLMDYGEFRYIGG